MHDMPDTEDADAAAERFWPEGYKDLLWADLIPAFAGLLRETEAFKAVYEQNYGDDFRTYDQFVDRLAEMVAIGAENGSDSIFDEIYAAFSHNAPLPGIRSYARSLWPDAFNQELKVRLHDRVIEEYKDLHAYEHVYEDHYEGQLTFDDYIGHIASLVVVGAQKGADDMIGSIYRAFLGPARLPTARRRPKRTM
jgi:hypothetical protein